MRILYLNAAKTKKNVIEVIEKIDSDDDKNSITFFFYILLLLFCVYTRQNIFFCSFFYQMNIYIKIQKRNNVWNVKKMASNSVGQPPRTSL